METTEVLTSPPRSWLRVRTLLWIGLGLVAVAAIALVLFLPRPYPATGYVEREYLIDESFPRVRRILVRTNVTRSVLGMSSSEYVDQETTGLSFNLQNFLQDRDWAISREGELRVRTNDPYIGQQLIALKQKADVQPNEIRVSTQLKEPAERLRDYYGTLTFAPGPEGKTQVRASLRLEILTTTPLVGRGVARTRVQQAAERTIAQQEKGLRAAIAEHGDSLLILP